VKIQIVISYVFACNKNKALPPEPALGMGEVGFGAAV